MRRLSGPRQVGCQVNRSDSKDSRGRWRWEKLEPDMAYPQWRLVRGLGARGGTREQWQTEYIWSLRDIMMKRSNRKTWNSSGCRGRSQSYFCCGTLKKIQNWRHQIFLKAGMRLEVYTRTKWSHRYPLHCDKKINPLGGWDWGELWFWGPRLRPCQGCEFIKKI